MLAVGRDDLVVGPEVEPGQDDVAALGRRGRERDVRGIDVHHAGERRACLPAQREHLVDVGLAAAAPLEVGVVAGFHRLDRRARNGAHRAGVQVRDPFEGGELRAGFVEIHCRDRSTGAWSDRSMPFRVRRASGHTSRVPGFPPRTRMWSIAGPPSEKP